jgi:hypothetical protein
MDIHPLSTMDLSSNGISYIAKNMRPMRTR